MKVYDSQSNLFESLNGVKIYNRTCIMPQDSSVECRFNGVSDSLIKIIGRRISGAGSLSVHLFDNFGSLIKIEKLIFSSASSSEKIIRIEGAYNARTIRFVRSSGDIGRIELLRVVVETSKEIPSTKDVEAYPEYKKAPLQLKKLAVIIPYGIYGGAEVYLSQFFKYTPDTIAVDFLYLQKNLLSSTLESPSISHINVENIPGLRLKLRSAGYDSVVFYNSKRIYELLIYLKEYEALSSNIIEIYHSDFLWQDAIASLKERKFVNKIIKIAPNLCNNIAGVKEYVFIPIPIDLNRFSMNTNCNKKEFGLVARLSPEKNIKYAISLFEKLPQYNLTIVGSGPLESEFKRYILNKNITNINIVGHKGNVEDYLHLFDAFILTSSMEGIPISILEAMSCGLPIFTTPVGQIPTYFGDMKGITYLSGNIENDLKLIIAENLEVHQNLRDFIIQNHNIELLKNKFFNQIIYRNRNWKQNNEESKVIFGELI